MRVPEPQPGDAVGSGGSTVGAPADLPPPRRTVPAPGYRPAAAAEDRTRLSVIWVGVVLGAVILILLLVFVLQNTQSARVSFLGFDGRVPLGVLLLLAAAIGACLAGILAGLRIVQLRLRARRRGGATPDPFATL